MDTWTRQSGLSLVHPTFFTPLQASSPETVLDPASGREKVKYASVSGSFAYLYPVRLRRTALLQCSAVLRTHAKVSAVHDTRTASIGRLVAAGWTD